MGLFARKNGAYVLLFGYSTRRQKVTRSGEKKTYVMSNVTFLRHQQPPWSKVVIAYLVLAELYRKEVEALLSDI